MAVGQITVSSPELLRPLATLNAGKSYEQQIKPFNFILSCHVAKFGHPNDADPERFHLLAPYERDPRKWLALPWIDQYSGRQISVAQNIVITGGRYGSNATNAASTTSGGIALTGAAVNVTITGADCSPVVPMYGTQPHALSITAAVEGLYVRGCNFMGYAANSPAVYANAAGTAIEITDCAGYNDARPTLTTTPPGNNVVFTAATYGYYGRAAFYVHGGVGTSVTVDNNATNLTSGGFTLDPGEVAAINYTAAPSFVMVGK